MHVMTAYTSIDLGHEFVAACMSPGVQDLTYTVTWPYMDVSCNIYNG